MTFGEQMFLGLVLALFAVFGMTLAIVASRTERFLRDKAAPDAHRQDLKKAA